MAYSERRIWLVRHGETAYSAEGRHTGWLDIPLTRQGQRQADRLRPILSRRKFETVLVSPLQRARETCRLAGFAESAEVVAEMKEWSYGDYEGRLVREIREERPGWNIWRDGVPNGESLEQVAQRARNVLEVLRQRKGDALLFAHGHLLRVLTSCWLELEPKEARRFTLRPASVSVLGQENGSRAIRVWNWEPAPGGD